jgi:DNA primase large subunit
MTEFDLDIISKYPFLRKSREYVTSLNLSLSEMQKHPLYSAGINLGKQRVLDALNGRINLDLSSNISKELAILSYAVARILVNLTGNRMIISKYAETEAEQAYRFLNEKRGAVPDEIKRDLGLEINNNKIKFQDYLRLSSNLAKQKPDWKISNRILDSGFVRLDGEEENHLLKEAIRLRVLEPVNLSGIPDNFKEIAKWINSTVIGTAKEIEIDKVDRDALPPCVSAMLVSLESGNASHNSMFIIATFFTNLGLKIDDVVKIFSKSPKFSEEKTRYQLEFLSGEKGGTKYTCPTCVKIKSYGLCVADCSVKHPLQYYRGKARE